MRWTNQWQKPSSTFTTMLWLDSESGSGGNFLNNPKNPIVRYFITRRSHKMAEELLKQLKDHESKEES